MKETVEILQDQALHSKLKLKYEGPETDIYVKTDEIRI